MSAIGATSITTDAAGNITEDASREYVIDAANRLESIDISSSTVGTYTYDANALRTKKVSGAGTVHYVYGMNGLLYGEYDNTGAMIREYVYLNGQPIAQYDAGTPDVITYLHTDHLGTPRAGSNSGGSGVWAWSSDAFGNGSPTGSATVNLRFPGQYYDSESGLHYNWNRYYDPATGRYVSSDPIGLAGGLNTFTYVGANPVMYTDPEGLFAIPLIPAVATLGASAACYLTDCANKAAEGIKGIINKMDGDSSTPDSAADDTPSLSVCTEDDPNGKDPCSGLRAQLASHLKKLADYREDPLGNDNKGILQKAMDNNDPDRAKSIYNGRVNNLESQIRNFRKQLKACEDKKNG